MCTVSSVLCVVRHHQPTQPIHPHQPHILDYPLVIHALTGHPLRSIDSMSAPAPDAVLHLAALHTLAQTGFASTSRAASLTLSATLSRYLQLVAATCAERASLAGRSKVVAIDVLQGLEELGVGGVGELHEWAVGLDQEVTLSGPGLAVLRDGLNEGMLEDEPYVELRAVRQRHKRARLENEWSPNKRLKTVKIEREETDGEASSEGEADGEETEGELEWDPDVKIEPIRHQSPDFSWLPPLPGDEAHPEIPAHISHEDPTTATTAPAAALSIIDRYRRRIPFSQSQLNASRPFADPPKPPTVPPLPAATSSFDSLATAYNAILGDFTVTLREAPLRQQAAELLRRTIASGEEFSPQDTLCVQIPGPRSTPIVPSHFLTEVDIKAREERSKARQEQIKTQNERGPHKDSKMIKELEKEEAEDVSVVVPEYIPPRAIPLNPSKDGVLTQLIHSIRSAHLPPTLRERLSSIRHPVPARIASEDEAGNRKVIAGPVFEPIVSGPSTVALAKARLKPVDPTMDPGKVQPTWPMAPRGLARWSAGLPEDDVVQSGVGEPLARRASAARDAGPAASGTTAREREISAPASHAANGTAEEKPRVRLSLSSLGGFSSRPSTPSEQPGHGLSAPVLGSPAALSPGAAVPAGGLKLKIKSPMGETPSTARSSPNGFNGSHAVGSASPSTSTGRPSLTIKFGAGGVSPNTPAGDRQDPLANAGANGGARNGHSEQGTNGYRPRMVT